MNILGHCSYVGTTGYNAHSQNFFRALSQYQEVKIRNFTIGKHWCGLDSTNQYPHGKDVNDIDQSLIGLQTLWNSKKELEDYEIHNFKRSSFKHDINLVLMEVNHYYFYQKYEGPKIAYTVWESTLYPDSFFNQLKTFDQIWVPTKWQAEITEKQGIPQNKIKVVPEGVDVDTFYPQKTHKNEKFTFVMFGRWDGRKSTTEIIRAFKNKFGNNENVQLLLSVDNPFANDDMSSTEERLKKYNLEAENIKVLHFLSREEYVKTLKNADVFLSCSRSEGWNLPLIEAMACGVPSIYSNCSGQLEFAENRGVPVDIVREIPIKELNEPFFRMADDVRGNWYEPDFKDLEKKMIEVYDNYESYAQKALLDSGYIRENFTWQKAAAKANEILMNFKTEYEINFLGFLEDSTGIKYNASTENDQKIIVQVFDNFLKKLLYEDALFINNKCVFWTKYENKNVDLSFKILDFFTREVKFETNINNVLDFSQFIKNFNFEISDLSKFKNIINESNSLGDFLAWTPVVARYAEENDIKVNYYTPYKNLLQQVYSNIVFYDYKDKVKISSYEKSISLGCFDHIDWRQMNLQEVACKILNLSYKESRPKISKALKKNRPVPNKYVCIATQSTAQCKYWNNPVGWQKVVDYLKLLDYEVICIDRNENFGIQSSMNTIPKNSINKTGDLPLENRINDIMHCEFFIGLGSGLSWLAWACDKPVVMISGFSDPKSEFYTPYRVHNKNVCNSCWNDSNHKFDPSNWLWCPRNKNFECSREITFTMVKEKIDECIKNIEKKDKSLHKNFNWGSTSNWFKETISREVFENKIYEKFFEVEQNDIVVDFGASVGPFTKSILHKKPKHIYCFEPSENMYNQLCENLSEENITNLNYAISNKDGKFIDMNLQLFSVSENQMQINCMNFQTFINKFNIKEINFLKTDCEGGEYDIFTKENYNWISNNVKKISGEWHLFNDDLKKKFKDFREIYLKNNNFWIYSIDGVDIKWSLWNEGFIEYYKEIIIYIKNE